MVCVTILPHQISIHHSTKWVNQLSESQEKHILYTTSPENPYFVGELILPYLMANGIFTVTNFRRTFTNKFQL